MNNAQITYSPVEAELPLYLEADNQPDDPSGTYRVSVEEFVDDDCVDRPHTDSDCALELDTIITWGIDFAGDEDWLKASVDTSSGPHYQFSVANSDSQDVSLELRAQDGNLHIADEGADEATLTFTTTDDSNYFAAVSFLSSETGDFSATYTNYSGGCPSNPLYPSALDYSNYSTDYQKCGAEAPGPDAGSATLSGSIEPVGDTDWFKITGMQADQSYQLDLTSGTDGLPDPLLRIYDAEGNELAVDDDGGSKEDAQLGFSPPADGDYFASAESSPKDDQRGGYSLEVANYSDRDCAGSNATDCGIKIGDTLVADGSTSWDYEVHVSGDSDWFAVSGMTAGESYKFELRNTDGILQDPYLSVYDSNGEELRSSGLSKDPAQLGFTPPDNGDYWIAAESGTEGDTGAYELSAGKFNDDHADCATSACSPGTLPVDDSANGELEVPGDRDWFKVDLESGNYYTFTLSGDTLGAPHVRLRTDDGSILASQAASPDSSEAKVTHEPGANQTVYLEAASVEDESAGTYTVSATAQDLSGGTGGGSSDGGGSGGGGGCALAAEPQPLDPTLPLLAGLGLAYLLRRGRPRA
ncbi:pre-peptidase C-terminal domain-containing protein [Thiohalorhabdus denitrificans]|nr:pre-peptidase C-terminal domain-containing protein [Thiohalorhabdus denitrificans]